MVAIDVGPHGNVIACAVSPKSHSSTNSSRRTSPIPSSIRLRAWSLTNSAAYRKRGEYVALEGIRFEVLRTDARQVQLLLIERLPQSEMKDDERTVAG